MKFKMNRLQYVVYLLKLVLVLIKHCAGQDVQSSAINVGCNGDNIMVELNDDISMEGIVYVDGQSKNESCRMELSSDGPKTYKLPLESCNTVLRNVSEGIEFSNTILIQPHKKLITKNGKRFHIRCLYKTKDGMVTSGFNVSALEETSVSASAPTPVCSMTFFIGDKPNGFPAERVNTGDTITMVVSMDTDQAYTFKVTDCVVNNGEGDVSQNLVNGEGCPIEPEIMGEFDYSEDRQNAMVSFNAHRFPDSNVVNYECMVHMCLRSAGQRSCEVDCAAEDSRKRRKRADEPSFGQVEQLHDGVDVSPSVMVYRGLLVSDGGVQLDESPPDSGVTPESPERCLEYRAMNLGLIVACTILLILVLAFIALLLQKKGTKRRKLDSVSSPNYPIQHRAAELY